MTKKKQKNAPPATEATKNEPEEAPSEDKGASMVPEATAPIQIPPKVLEQAKALGVDLGQIVDWAQGVEQKFVIVQKNFEAIQSEFTKLQPLVDLSQKLNQQQSAAQPQAPGGVNIASLLQLVPAMLGGGGDSELAELGKKALMSQISMSTAITNAVVAKITGKATSDVAAVVTGA